MSINCFFIEHKLFKEMVDIGRQKFPLEICGFLIGTGFFIKDWIELENTSAKPYTFHVKQEAVDCALAEVVKRESEVIAIFHTHPTTNPIPSTQDIYHHPDKKLLMAILSYKNKEPILKCYRINENSYTEVPFFIV